MCPWSPMQEGARDQSASACRGLPSKGEARALHHQPRPSIDPYHQHTTWWYVPSAEHKGEKLHKHVTRARGWLRRGDVSACTAHANMEWWTHQNINLDVDTVNQHLRDAWEQKNDKYDLKGDLQGLEQQFWLRTEAGCIRCYDFPGETWAGDDLYTKEK